MFRTGFDGPFPAAIALTGRFRARPTYGKQLGQTLFEPAAIRPGQRRTATRSCKRQRYRAAPMIFGGRTSSQRRQRSRTACIRIAPQTHGAATSTEVAPRVGGPPPGRAATSPLAGRASVGNRITLPVLRSARVASHHGTNARSFHRGAGARTLGILPLAREQARAKAQARAQPRVSRRTPMRR